MKLLIVLEALGPQLAVVWAMALVLGILKKIHLFNNQNRVAFAKCECVCVCVRESECIAKLVSSVCVFVLW